MHAARQGHSFDTVVLMVNIFKLVLSDIKARLLNVRVNLFNYAVSIRCNEEITIDD